MLSIRPTTLTGSKYLKWLVSFATIADVMRRENVFCLMRALWLPRTWVKRNPVIKGKSSGVRLAKGKINDLFTDVTPSPVTFKDSNIVYRATLCFSLAYFTTTALLGILQARAWFLAILAIIGITAFSLFIRDVLPLFPIAGQYLFSHLLPLITTLRQAAIIAPYVMSIRRVAFHLDKLGQGLFLLTNPASLVSRTYRQAPYLASPALVLCTLIGFVYAIIARCSIASAIKRVNIKSANRLFNTALLTYQRDQYLTLRGILKISQSFLPSLLIDASFTPRLRFTASAWASFMKLIQELFFMTLRTHPSGKQKELNNMIHFRHSYGPPIQVRSLDAKGITSTFSIEQISLIIPYTRPTSNFAMLPTEIGGVLCQ